MLGKAFFLLAVLLAASFAFAAVSDRQAVDFIAGSNFLNAGETAEIFPAVSITHSSTKYWVVTILSNNTPSGFAAVKASTQQPEVSISKGSNEQLFKTAYFLRAFLKNKDSALSQNQWFFSQSNIDFLNTLNRLLQSEKDSELPFISSEAKNASITSKVDDLEDRLGGLKTLSAGISEKISAEIKLENDFFASPKTDQTNALASAFQDLKEDIESLEQKAIDYDSKVSELQRALANTDIELEKKIALSKLAEAPSSLSPSVISAKKQTAGSNIQAVQQVLQDSVNNSLVFAESFSSRYKKSLAFNELYSEDSVLKEKTKTYSVLKLAVDDILSTEKASKWKNQSEVSKLGQYWSDAEQAFKKTNYDTAVENAQKAKQSVILIAKAGFKDTEPPPIEYNTEVFIQAAIGVGIILVLVIIIRKVLPKLLKPKEESAEDFEESFRIKR